MLEVLMPTLPPRVKKVKLVEWHKAEGDEVQQGDLLAVIETNKVSIEIEAEHEGTLVKILVAEGTEGIAEGTPLALLEAEAEIVCAKPADPLAFDKLSKGALASGSRATKRFETPTFTEAEPDHSITAEGVEIFATPLALRIARQRGIDLTALSGSGPYGRIVEKDLEQALSSQAQPK